MSSILLRCGSAQETGWTPGRLELEITESVLVDDFSRAVAILRRLKAMGVRISMDDFGTGYSSLSYLQSFPFDKIRDRSSTYLRSRPQSSVGGPCTRIGLGRGLDLPVVAEGWKRKSNSSSSAKKIATKFRLFDWSPPPNRGLFRTDGAGMGPWREYAPSAEGAFIREQPVGIASKRDDQLATYCALR